MFRKILKRTVFTPFSVLFPKSKAVPQEPKKILIIRSGAIGDVLMTTPLVAGIRKKWPNAQVHYLVGEWSRPVLDNNPNIDQVVGFPDELIVKRIFSQVWHLASQLRRNRYDICFILDKSWLWNMFAKRAGCRFRIGFDRHGEGFPNTLSVPFRAEKHEIDYYDDIAKAAGISAGSLLSMFPSLDDEIKVGDILKRIGAAKIIGIAPGGAVNPGQSLMAKRWPKQNYAQLCAELVKNDRNELLFFGGKDDRFLCEALIDTLTGGFALGERLAVRKRIMNLCGQLNVQQSYLLMQHCDYFVTNDSGAMHLAAAAGLKENLIVIFGPTSPLRFAPKGSTVLPPKKLPKGYDPEQDVYKHITPEQIEYASVQDVLGKMGGAR